MHHDTGAQGIPGHDHDDIALAWAYLATSLVGLIEMLAVAEHTELEERLTAHRTSTPVLAPEELQPLDLVLQDALTRVRVLPGRDSPWRALDRDEMDQLTGATMAVRHNIHWYRIALKDADSSENALRIIKDGANRVLLVAAPVARDARAAQYLSLIVNGLDPFQARAVTDAVLA